MDEKAKTKLANELSVFFESDEGSTPEERTARHQKLCSPLEWLLESLMDGQTGWDSRYSWIDGISRDTITRTSRDTVRLDGLAIVVHNKEWRLRPIQADLARPDAVSTIRFAAPTTELAYPQRRHRPHAVPTNWPYVFEVVLT